MTVFPSNRFSTGILFFPLQRLSGHGRRASAKGPESYWIGGGKSMPCNAFSAIPGAGAEMVSMLKGFGCK
jgi:hypothetical protein